MLHVVALSCAVVAALVAGEPERFTAAKSVGKERNSPVHMDAIAVRQGPRWVASSGHMYAEAKPARTRGQVVGENIRQAIRDAKLTQVRLGLMLVPPVEQWQMSRWVNGVEPSWGRLGQIAEATGKPGRHWFYDEHPEA